MSEQREESCIEGMACPKCGHTIDFYITATTRAVVAASGVKDVQDFEWDDESTCCCPMCDHTDTVAAFHTETEEAA